MIVLQRTLHRDNASTEGIYNEMYDQPDWDTAKLLAGKLFVRAEANGRARVTTGKAGALAGEARQISYGGHTPGFRLPSACNSSFRLRSRSF